MSNTLSIRVVEFRDVGSDESVFGYLAKDDHAEAVYEVSKTLEGFRQEFPDMKSLIDHVLNEPAFAHLDISYSIVGGYPDVPNLDEDCSANLSLPNIHQVY
jgi:hypothetical protein